VPPTYIAIDYRVALGFCSKWLAHLVEQADQSLPSAQLVGQYVSLAASKASRGGEVSRTLGLLCKPLEAARSHASVTVAAFVRPFAAAISVLQEISATQYDGFLILLPTKMLRKLADINPEIPALGKPDVAPGAR
jgi:hypothetical protein